MFFKFKNLMIHHLLVYFVGHLVYVIAARGLRESPGWYDKIAIYI
jgi:hypothetical protein